MPSDVTQQRILVVEDEAAIADAVIYALATEGFDPSWRTTGREGLSALREGGADLVILDIGLPDANGFELFREIREISAAPIIFLTARAEEIDRVVGLEMGADDYVVKPFSPRELTARVRAVLRRAGQSEPEPQQSDSAFRVDTERMQIAYHGKALTLSRYEYRLLKVLVDRPGRVYSRDQLMELAWNDPEASFDRTVDTHIKTLRAKLRAAGADPDPIKTHRGLGYSLRADE